MQEIGDLIYIDHSPQITPKRIYKQRQCQNSESRDVPKISLLSPESEEYFPTRHSVSFEIPKIRLENMSNKITCYSDDTDNGHRRYSDINGDTKTSSNRNVKPIHLVKQEAICESQGTSKESLRLIRSMNNSSNLSSSILESYKKKLSLSGIDAISLDYMKANGNLRGFRQLQHTKDLISQNKAASFSVDHSSLFQSSVFKKVNISLPSDEEKGKYVREESEKLLNERQKVHTVTRQISNFTKISPLPSTGNLRPRFCRSKSMRTVGSRLGKRKRLLEQRKKITNFSVGFAVFGIIAMIFELELCDNMKLYNKNSIYSYFLKSLIGVSTLILICLIVLYHFIEVKIISFDDSIEDWRITVSLRRIFQLIIEIFICSIHPFPGKFLFKWSIYLAGKKEISDSNVSFDIIFGIAMFFRLYLFHRCMLLHSRLLSDVGSRSIGAMNKVNFNTYFLIKTMMTLYPVRVLFIFIFTVIILSSWILHTCENAYDSFHADMFNAIWLICITFLSIGYGDVFPHTVCGRIVAIVNGLMGCACTALVVAVFAKRLELTKAERHVMEFMMDNHLSKKLKFYAANVLRETWLLYKYTKLTENINIMQVWSHQRKFLRAIYGLRKMKSELRRLEDESNQIRYLIQGHHQSHLLLAQICQDQMQIKNNISILEERIIQLQNQTNEFPDLIAQRLIKFRDR